MEGSAGLKDGIHVGTDLVTPTNVANHIVIRDGEITIAGGAAQSKANSAPS